MKSNKLFKVSYVPVVHLEKNFSELKKTNITIFLLFFLEYSWKKKKNNINLKNMKEEDPLKDE